jgi:hypothetical protein
MSGWLRDLAPFVALAAALAAAILGRTRRRPRARATLGSRLEGDTRYGGDVTGVGEAPPAPHHDHHHLPGADAGHHGGWGGGDHGGFTDGGHHG